MLPSDKDMVINLIMPVTTGSRILDYSVPLGYMYHRGKCSMSLGCAVCLDYMDFQIDCTLRALIASRFLNFFLVLDKMFCYVCFKSSLLQKLYRSALHASRLHPNGKKS
jgi:hypothetical protein